METAQAHRYITPTLQANWNLAISEVIRCLNSNLTYETWLALQTLYDILPPEIYKEVTVKHDMIEKEFLATATDSSSYEAQILSFNNGMNILRKHERTFFREMYELLYKGGYLEKKTGPSEHGGEW